MNNYYSRIGEHIMNKELIVGLIVVVIVICFVSFFFHRKES